jgi:hypothetical protein
MTPSDERDPLPSHDCLPHSTEAVLRRDVAFWRPDSGAILFGQVIRTIELARKLADEVIDCEHITRSCRCGDRSAYNDTELAAFELIYRCADMFACSPYPVAVIEGLALPPRQFAALGCDEDQRARPPGSASSAYGAHAD